MSKEIGSDSLTSAYNQLQTYKSQIPSLFRTNAALVTSDGLMARIGSLTANEERFMPWRTTDGTDVAAKGSPEMSVLIEGVFEQRRFLDLIRDFTVFGDTGSGISKIIAAIISITPCATPWKARWVLPRPKATARWA